MTPDWLQCEFGESGGHVADHMLFPDVSGLGCLGKAKKHVWGRRWCSLNGTRLCCAGPNGGALASRAELVDLAGCTSVSKSNRGRAAKPTELAIACGGAKVSFLVVPGDDGKMVWGRALTTAMVASVCRRAVHTAPIAPLAPFASLATAVALTKLSDRTTAAEYWSTAAAAIRVPEVLLAAGWARVERAAFECLRHPCFRLAEHRAGWHPAPPRWHPAPPGNISAELFAGATLMATGLEVLATLPVAVQLPGLELVATEIARADWIAGNPDSAVATVRRFCPESPRCRALLQRLDQAAPGTVTNVPTNIAAGNDIADHYRGRRLVCGVHGHINFTELVACNPELVPLMISAGASTVFVVLHTRMQFIGTRQHRCCSVASCRRWSCAACEGWHSGSHSIPFQLQCTSRCRRT